MSKKSVGGGAAGGSLRSGVVIGYGTVRTIAVEGESSTETGMVSLGREATSSDRRENLWACLVREASRVDR